MGRLRHDADRSDRLSFYGCVSRKPLACSKVAACGSRRRMDAWRQGRSARSFFQGFPPLEGGGQLLLQLLQHGCVAGDRRAGPLVELRG